MVKRIIYPPIWLLFGLIAIFACNEYYPGLRFTSLAWQVVGAVLIVAGLLLLVTANGLFTRAGTGLIPFRNVSALVTEGIYQYTRNPMYLGMLAVLAGCALTVGAATALLVPPLFAVIIEVRFIRPEEEMLRGIFPQDYPAYCERVRRWL
ncbi:MAG: isoprenylcysteine carboxylmethyltransferase family protein [Halioglobus sp.]|nr:isoprenylcysteine carboxylmethyltransferase family protein [Halioglobus sp.]